MSHQQNINDRLDRLKGVSEELKYCSVDAQLNVQKIKQLLNYTRLSHAKDHKDSQEQTMIRNRNSHIYQLTSNDLSFKPLFPDPAPKQQQFYNQSKQLQIIQLKQKNQNLQQKLKDMAKQIQKLQTQNISLKTNNDHLPYFKLIQNIQGFIASISISIENMNKLDFSSYEIELKLDRLVLLKKQKQYIQQFDLTTLKDAKYRQNILMLSFQQFISDKQKSYTNVVLKFNTSQQLHKWDLSIFVNYQLLNSINQPQLFSNYFLKMKIHEQKQKERQKIQQIKDKKQLGKNNRNDLLKLLINKRDQYLQIHDLFKQKLKDKIIQAQLLQINQQFQNHLQPTTLKAQKNGQKKVLEEMEKKQSPIKQIGKKTPIKIPLENPRGSSKKHSPIQEIGVGLDIIQQQSEQGNQKQIINQSPIDNFPITSAIINSNANSQILQGQVDGRFKQLKHGSELKTNIEPITNNKNESNLNLNLSHSLNNFFANTQNNSRRSTDSIVNQLNNSLVTNKKQLFQSNLKNSSIHQNAYNTARINLQNGYLATKYSKNGFNFHDKKVFMSLDCKKLCWSQKDKLSDYKSIPLEVITQVQYEVLGEGILKHVKEPIASHYCVIEYYTTDYKKKTIELGSDNIFLIKSLASDLNIILKKHKAEVL